MNLTLTCYCNLSLHRYRRTTVVRSAVPCYLIRQHCHTSRNSNSNNEKKIEVLPLFLFLLQSSPRNKRCHARHVKQVQPHLIIHIQNPLIMKAVRISTCHRPITMPTFLQCHRLVFLQVCFEMEISPLEIKTILGYILQRSFMTPLFLQYSSI